VAARLPPASSSPAGGANWSRAAAGLAQRVNRRARWAAALRWIGLSLLCAAALSMLWRALGPPIPGLPDRTLVALLLGSGTALGLIPALLAARRAPQVSPGDAAWALDRLVSARGRGLAAAVATGPAASEAAFSKPPLSAPPPVKLHPPSGLVPFLGALILGTLAVLAPARGAGLPPGDRTSDGAGGAGATPGAGSGDGPRAQAARAEAQAAALDAETAAAERVRAALNLPSDGPLDPQEVAKRLSDPQRRAAAAAAASAGTSMAELLADEQTSGDALARLLAKGGDNPALAAQHRREAAAARARRPALPVPPSRRDLVERYLRLKK